MELNKDFERLEELVARINRTNNETKSGDASRAFWGRKRR